MTGTTTTFGFLYPVQTDRMCDSVTETEDGHLQLFVDQLEARLDTFESTIARATNPPMCFVQFRSDTAQPLTVGDPASGGYIHWNEVLVDNFEMFDIGADPSRIILPLGYRWQVGLYLDFVGAGVNGEFRVTLETGTQNPTASTHDAGATDEYTSLTDVVTPSGSAGYMRVKVVHSAVATLSIRSGRAWAYWHSDV